MSEFEIYDGKDDGEVTWRWRLIDDNHVYIGRSVNARLKRDIVEQIKEIRAKVDNQTKILEVSDAPATLEVHHFEFFKSKKDGEWYWRLKDSDGDIIAIGGEGFKSRSNVEASIENFSSECCRASIKWEDPSENPAFESEKEQKESGQKRLE